ncbi:MAG: stage III sporulation protein AE [Clostridia bacterium]|nr:stage III sporulation protein AE [Clostridia bacterium]
MLQKSVLNKKYLIIFAVILILIASLILILSPLEAHATSKAEEEIREELEDNVEENLNDIDFSKLVEFENSLGKKVYEGGITALIKDILSGKYEGSFADTFNMIINMLGVSVKGFIPLLVTLVAVAVIFSIVNGLTSGFMSKSTTEIIHFVCYSAMIVLLMTEVSFLIADSVQAIKNMSKFMEVIFPIMLTLVTALGGIATTATYSPMMTVLSVGVAKIISSVVLPCFIATMALSIVGFISKDIKLNKLTRFFKSAGEIIIGVVFGLFTTFVTTNGISGALADNISIKSAKFAISSYVPILGGYLSDGLDLAVASVMLVKNAVGVGGVIMMLTIVLSPVIKILIFSLGLKLVAGIIEPIGNKRMSEITFAISKNLTLLVVAMLGMAFMFFIMMILILLTCNAGI